MATDQLLLDGIAGGSRSTFPCTFFFIYVPQSVLRVCARAVKSAVLNAFLIEIVLGTVRMEVVDSNFVLLGTLSHDICNIMDVMVM